MDGLLLDSEKIALECFLEACQTAGFTPDISLYLKCIGTNSKRTKQILLEGFGGKFPFDEVFKHWGALYYMETIEKPVPLKRGAKQLLEKLKNTGYPMAIATSTAHNKAIVKLKNAGILDYFELIIGGDQVKNSKPDPEIYSTAANKLGINADKCIAIEDSDNGVKSAHGAGISVIQIPDLQPPSNEVKELGHTILDSLFDIEMFFNQS